MFPDDIKEHFLREWLHLKAGVKRGAVIPCPPEYAERIAATMNEGVFYAVAVSPGDLDDCGITDAAYVFAGRDAASSREVRELYLEERRAQHEGRDHAGLTRRLGGILGYPECCVDAFLGLSSHRDEILVRASYYGTAGKIEPLLLTLPRGSPSILLHTPCRLDCPASLEIAEEVFSAAKEADPEYASLVEHALGCPLLFISRERYLRFDGVRPIDGAFSFEGLFLHPEERRRLDPDWLGLFDGAGVLHIGDDGGCKISIGGGEPVEVADPASPVPPILFVPGESTGFKTPLSVILMETYPNEDEQMLSSFFPKLYAGDLAENGIDANYLAYHRRIEDEAYNDGMDRELLRIAGESNAGQAYFFRSYPRSLARLLKDEYGGAPRVLIDNTTPSRAHEITHAMPVIDRGRFIRTVIALGRGAFPEWVVEMGEGKPARSVWAGMEALASDRPVVDPAHPANMKLSAVRLNDRVTGHRPALEIMARPTCPHRAACSVNPVYLDVDLTDVPYDRGCAFCTARVPWWRAISKRDALASLVFQLDLLKEEGGGEEVIRILDQAVLPLLPELIENAAERHFASLTWLLDLRTPELLSGEEILRDAIGRAGDASQRIDLFCIGFENFSDSELLRFNKGVSSSQNHEAVKLIERLSAEFPDVIVRTRASSGFVLFTPWTSMADLESNLKAIRELSFIRFRSGAIFTKLRLYRESPLYKLALKDGLIIGDYSDSRFDASEKFGYSPEEPWSFKDETVARVYSLIAPMGERPGIVEEVGLLEFALDFVRGNKPDLSESGLFNRLAGRFIKRGGEQDLDGPILDSADGAPVDIPSKVRAAISEHENAILKGRDGFERRMELANLYVSINRPADALPHFMAAYRQNPSHPDPPLRVGEILIDLGRLEKARAILTEAGRRYSDKGFIENIDRLLDLIGSKDG